tara:strand:+ start:110 stop:730 length:621 start_codon:yes stop_codon:yes gene_type:complete
MEEITEALENKQVERVRDDEAPVSDESNNIDILCQESSDASYNEPPKPKKRQRSQKQIETFEKAKLKRAENILKKKEEKEQLKKDRKLEKTKIREQVKRSVIDDLPVETVNYLKEEAVREQPKYKPVLQTPEQAPQPSWGAPQPIINNYYYGTNEYPMADQRPKGSGRNSRKVVVESSSSEEEYEEEEIIEEYIQPTEPTLKYKFV